MAFLRIKRIGARSYFYIVESRRSGPRVRQKTLQYLGPEPDDSVLKRAMSYWGVKRRTRRNRGEKGP
jgi:hypothetical protein